MGLEPASAHPSVHTPVHTFKMNISETSSLIEIKFHLKHLWDGEGYISARKDQNAGIHGNRYLLLGYNGENLMSTLAPQFLIGSS